jgi:hypothetical protein
MISRREFMAGSVALAASSASTRLAPEPESIWINDINSQLNPYSGWEFHSHGHGKMYKAWFVPRAKIERQSQLRVGGTLWAGSSVVPISC